MPPVVVAVAAGVAAGVFVTSAVVGLAVGLGVYALSVAMKPEMPGLGEDVSTSQSLSTGSLVPRRGIYGETVVSGTIVGYGKRIMKLNGKDTDFHVVAVAIAGHPCESVTLYRVNDKPAPAEVIFTPYLGSQTAVDPVLRQIVSGWTNQHIGKGITYAVVQLPIDQDLLPQGLRNITFQVKGKKVYDPRKDSSVGGNGAQRADQPETWAWSDNPIICAFDYMRFHGYREQPINRFDFTDIAAEANACDELVTITKDGNTTTEKRFTANGTWTFDEGPAEVLQRILTSCAGKPYRRGGKIHFKAATYHGPATLEISTEDLAGTVKYRPNTSEREKCNVVRAAYIDPTAGYIAAESPVLKVDQYITEDGVVREQEIRLPFTTSVTMAQRLQKYQLERNRAGFMVELTVGPKGLLAEPGKTITLHLPEDGIDAEFIVADWTFDNNKKTVSLVLIIEQPELYSDDIHAQVTRPSFNVPDNTAVAPPAQLTFTGTTAGRDFNGTLKWQHPTANAVEYYVVRVYSDPNTQTANDETLVIEERIEGSRLLEFAVNGLPSGDYIMEVSAVSKYGKESLPVRIFSAIYPPQAPSAINITASNFELIAAPVASGMTYSTAFEFDYVAGLQAPANYTPTAKYRGITAVVAGLMPDSNYVIFARTVSPYGQSAWISKVAKTTLEESKIAPFVNQIKQDLQAAQNALNTLNNTTIPGINADIQALEGQFPISTAQIADAAITAGKIAAQAVDAGKIASGAVNTTHIAALAVNTSNIAANAVTATQIANAAIVAGKIAANAVSATEIASNAVTSAKIADSAITTTKIADAAIATGKIAAGAVTATEIAALAVNDTKIAANAITNAKIANGAISTAKIAAGAVTATEIAALAVNDTKIAAAAVTTAKIADGAVATAKIAMGAVTANEIANLTISAGKIADGAIATAKIADGAIVTGKIALGAVTATEIAALAVNDTKLADNAVTTAKVAALAIDAGKLASGAVTTSKIATGAVTANELAALAVTAAKVADNAITTAKIADGAIATGKIALGAVTANEIADLAINDAKIADSAITTAKISALAVDAGKIATGAVTTSKIAAAAVTANEIAALAVTAAKVADNAITTTKISDGAVATAKIAAGAVTANEIAALAVTAAKVADNAITTTKIVDGAIASAKLAAGAVDSSKLNIQIGGGNLCFDSSFESTSATWLNYNNSGSGATSRFDTGRAGGRCRVTIIGSTPGTTFGTYKSDAVKGGWLTGVPYIVSFYAKKKNGTSLTSCQLYWNNGPQTTTALLNPTLTENWQRYAFRIQWTDGALVPTSNGAGSLWISARGSWAAADEFWIDDIQVEQGDTMTAYAPMPDEILPGTIATVQIADNAISAPKIAAGAIVAGKIAAGVITATEIASNAVTASAIASGAVTAGKIAANAVTANEIAAGSITTAKVAASAITANEIATGAVTTAKILAGAITANEIASNAITSAKLDAGAVTAGKIAAGSITASELAANSVTATQISTGAVTTAKLAASAVTANEIAAGAITTAKIAAGAVTASEIAAGSIVSGKIAAGVITSAEIAANAITSTAIAAGQITTSKIAAGAITANEIAAGAITTAKITAGAVTATEIASGAVTTGKIAANAVTATEIAAGAITTAKIAANAITANEVASGAITASKILVTNSGAALNDDPGFTDLAAWVLSSPNITRASNPGGAGVGQFYVTATSATDQFAQCAKMYPCDPAKVYKLSAMLFAASGNNRNIYIYVEFYTGNGTYISTATGWGGTKSGYVYGGQPVVGDWRRHGDQFGAGTARPIPTTAKQMRIGVWLQYSGSGTSAVQQACSDLRVEECVGADLIVDGAIVASKVAAGAITAGKIAANAITANEISAGSVTTAKIATGAVTANEIAAGAITTAKILAGAITANEIAASTITSAKIAADAITSAQLAAGSVVAGKLAANAVTATEIASGSITTAKIAALAVTASEIASNAITSAKIDAGAVTAGKIAAASITSAELAANSVTATQIASGSITAAKIAAGTITATEIASGAITTAKIAASAITASEIASGAVTTAKISAGAITANEIAAGAITTSKISASAITANEIASSAVTTAKIAANAVTATQIAAGAVTAGKVAANAITATEIAAGAITATKLMITGGGVINADPFLQDADAWGNTSGTSAIFQITDAPVGNKVLRSTSNSAHTNEKFYHAIDPTKTYRVRFWVRSATGTNGVLYFDLRQFTEPGVPCASNGGRSPYKPGAAAANTSWVEWSVTWGPGDWQAGVKFVQLDWLLNYGGTAGYMEICFPRFEEMAPADLIVDGAITTQKIAASAVTAAQIAANAITATQVAAGAITAAKLAVDSVTATAIASGSIITDKIATGAITAVKVAAGAIEADKIAAGAVNATAIAAGAITADKIASQAITAAQIASLTITSDKIAANAITADKITALTITGDKIAASAISGDKIAANAITADKLAANAITADKIAASTITADKVSSNFLRTAFVSTGGLDVDDGVNRVRIRPNNKTPILFEKNGVATFFVDIDGKGYFAGQLAPDTVNAAALSVSAKQAINPYFLGSGESYGTKDTAVRMVSGATFDIGTFTTLKANDKVVLIYRLQEAVEWVEGVTGGSEPSYVASSYTITLQRRLGATGSFVSIGTPTTLTITPYSEGGFTPPGEPYEPKVKGYSYDVNQQFTDTLPSDNSNVTYRLLVTLTSGSGTTAQGLLRRQFTGEKAAFKLNEILVSGSVRQWIDKETGFTIITGEGTVNQDSSATFSFPRAVAEVYAAMGNGAFSSYNDWAVGTASATTSAVTVYNEHTTRTVKFVVYGRVAV